MNTTTEQSNVKIHIGLSIQQIAASHLSQACHELENAIGGEMARTISSELREKVAEVERITCYDYSRNAMKKLQPVAPFTVNPSDSVQARISQRLRYCCDLIRQTKARKGIALIESIEPYIMETLELRVPQKFMASGVM